MWRRLYEKTVGKGFWIDEEGIEGSKEEGKKTMGKQVLGRWRGKGWLAAGVGKGLWEKMEGNVFGIMEEQKANESGRGKKEDR